MDIYTVVAGNTMISKGFNEMHEAHETTHKKGWFFGGQRQSWRGFAGILLAVIHEPLQRFPCFKINGLRNLNYIFRYTVLAALLSGCHSGYVVYGDSQTAMPDPADSWCAVVNEIRADNPDAGVPYMACHAVPGLSIMEFDLPTWIKPTPGLPGLMLVLGGNDVLNGTPVAEYQAKLAQIVAQAHAQGFQDVTCVALEQFKAELVCDVVITLPLYLGDSPDGWHMGPKGQREFAIDLLLKMANAEGVE